MQVHQPQVVALLEPRISRAVGAAVWDKLGFHSSFIVEAEGFSGGIWLLWNDEITTIRILTSSKQFIHTEIEWEAGNSVTATFVYVSPSLQGICMLWDDLRQLARSGPHAWAADPAPTLSKGWKPSNLFSTIRSRFDFLTNPMV
ncbi:hypothetical protein LINPERPRIM_LOCUS35493 [Linum perenne]